MENIKMRDHASRAMFRFLIVFPLGMLLVGTSYPAKSFDAPQGAGTLSYRGAVTGSATFQSADCTFDTASHLVVFDAPHQDKSHPGVKTPGPLLSIGFVDPGAMIGFTIDHINTTAQNAFMTMQKQDGISVAKKGDAWVLTLSDVRLPDQDVMNQKFITLSGSLTCTHLING
jgi:hypothetical protein